MRNIYSRVKHTCVWLGPVADDSGRALGWLCSIHLPAIPRTKPYTQEDVDKIVEELTEDFTAWRAPIKLLSRPWFDRVWVAQEVVLSRNISILCGDRIFAWTRFIGFCNTFQHMNRKLPRLLNTDQRAHAIKCVARCISLDLHAKKSSTGHDFRDSLTVLNFTHGRSARYPVDQLFAIRGMLPEEQRDWISVDYKRSETDVWVNCFKGLIDKSASLLWKMMARAPTVGKPLNVPSWCPDIIAGDIDGVAMCGPGFIKPSVLASRRLPAKILHGSRNSVTISGLQVDEVCQTAPCLGRNCESRFEIMKCESMKWERQCSQLFQSARPSDKIRDEDIEMYIRTLIIQPFLDSRTDLIPDEEELRVRFQEYVRLLEADGQPKGEDFRRFDHNIKFYGAMRFFTTTDGRIGMGPGSIRRGDLIWMLDACPCLWVLRKVDGSFGRTLIGTAYMYGLMFGGLEALDKETGNPQVTIV